MLKMPVSEVISKIQKQSGLSETEIKDLIAEKVKTLDGLVSEEGAAYIIASELGVRVFDTLDAAELKIKDLLIGMKNADVVGKITRLFEPRTFTKDGKPGKVGSFILADETGTARITIWDERVNWLTDGKLSEDQVVKIKSGIVKEGRGGGKEIHLTLRSKLILNVKEEITLPDSKQAQLIKVADVQDGQNVKLLGTIVKIFSPNFYTVCPQCEKKVTKAVEGFICTEHKVVEPKPAMVFSFIIDDGTESLRCVSFRQTAEKILSFSAQEAQELSVNETAFAEKIDARLLGREVEVEGFIKNNIAFDRRELAINNIVLEPNAKIIVQRMMRGK